MFNFEMQGFGVIGQANELQRRRHNRLCFISNKQCKKLEGMFMLYFASVQETLFILDPEFSF